jgi:hypothetical protein
MSSQLGLLKLEPPELWAWLGNLGAGVQLVRRPCGIIPTEFKKYLLRGNVAATTTHDL